MKPTNPSPRLRSRFTRALAFAGLCAISTASAQLEWNPGNTDPASGGNGGWLTASTWWNGTTNVNWITSSNATLGGTAGRIQLNGTNNATLSVGTLTFATPGYTIDLADSNGGTNAMNLTLTGLSGNGTILNSSTSTSSPIRTVTFNLTGNNTWGGNIGTGGNGRLNFTLTGGGILNHTGDLVIGTNNGQPTLTVTGGSRLNLQGTASGAGTNVNVGGNSTLDLGNNLYSARQWTLASTGTITTSGTGRLIVNSQFADPNLAGTLSGSLGVEVASQINASRLLKKPPLWLL